MIKLFVPTRQAALHIPGTGPANDPERGHLFIILTDRDENGDLLLVPICSVRKRHDITCLLGVGDHRFVREPSFVKYSLAGLHSAEVLRERVLAGDITYRGLIDEKVFALISAGLEQSPMSTPFIKAYYRKRVGR